MSTLADLRAGVEADRRYAWGKELHFGRILHEEGSMHAMYTWRERRLGHEKHLTFLDALRDSLLAQLNTPLL